MPRRTARWLPLAALLLAALAFVGTAAPGLAQTAAPTATSAAANLDYDAWDKVATRAEALLAAPDSTDADLSAVRSELTTWRDRFQSAEGANQGSVDILQGQIDALGPVPAEGETEAEDIAARRKALNDQMATLTAPRRAAQEAYTRADGLIRQIDTTLRARQADKLLELGPSPLNPALWPQGAGDLLVIGTDLYQETADRVGSDTIRAKLRANLPATLLFLVIAAVLVTRGRYWMELLTLAVQRRLGGRSNAQVIAGFVASVGQLVLPTAGLLSLAAALGTTGLLGTLGNVIASGLVGLGLSFFGARWMAWRLLPHPESGLRPVIDFTPEQAVEARSYAGLLGLLAGVQGIVTNLFDHVEIAAASRAVLQFPLTVVVGLILFRLGQLLTRATVPPRDSEAEALGNTMRETILTGLGRAGMVLGAGAIILAAIGYSNAAAQALWPAITTLALIGLVAILSRLLTAIYGAFTRKDDAALSDALVPVLISFALVIAALPVAALIWGARTSDLSELWTRFRAGAQIGDTHISPTNFLTFAIVFGIGYLVTRLIQQALASTVLPKTRLDIGGQNALRVGIGYVGIFLAGLIAISTAGIDLSSLAIVAGALSLGVGFGLQTIVQNFVSGIILLVERPISEGDWIKVGDQMGFVRNISVRSTRIETFDRTDVIIPNADLISGQVTNYTRGNSIGRCIIPVGVAYGSDTRRVEAILSEIAHANPLVALSPPPQVLFTSFGADSLNFEVRVILPNITTIPTVTSEMHHAIAERFKAEGVEIPFAQRDIWLRNPEALRGAAPEPAAPEATPPAQPEPTDAAAPISEQDAPGEDGGDGDR